MRISDWSSDVCSSDLHDSHARHARKEKGAQLRPRALDRKTADQALQGPMLVPVTCICISIWPPVGAAVLVVIVMSVFFGSKIGGASCRERVCEYVSISVVAVSLKKKNKTRRNT